MANAKTTTKSSVIEQAAKCLKIPSSHLKSYLLDIGIEDNEEGYKLLRAKTTTEEYLASIIRKRAPKVVELKVLAAASILKGQNPFEEEEEPKNKEPEVKKETADKTATVVLEAISQNRTPAQMKDRELLEAYAKDREYEIEQELHKRAKFKRFVVLEPGKYEPGKEKIDINKSLDILKKARKMEIPQMASFDGKILQVHRITELNPEDRKTELCPTCNKALFQGYCQDCNLDYGGIGMEERAYVKLVTGQEGFNPDSFSDRKAIHASAVKGVEDLKTTWPSVAPEFEDLKASNNLPQVVIMKPVLSEKKMDPFGEKNNRSY